ncbi:hypothetical protein AVEN_6977-1 [Araneus ventricosus]|uniref:Uncharacterized protein n=1 Tax=Araneus ventricosus TaxID=182803 RepID=A0A4Y2L499_ARAVE|nr:hypothetical protein AVEN_6977-1 [Araneus ventricosus]
MSFRNRSPTRVLLSTVRNTVLRLAWATNAAIELLMTGNKLPGLTSLVSNCIGWMDMYWYRDNLMNPWAQHVNRELFNLKRSPPPGTPMDLRTALQDSWCEKPPGYLQTLVDTMPRIPSLLCARVGPKRY